MTPKYKTVSMNKRAYEILSRAAAIKHWTLVAFFDILAELFESTLDLIKDDSIPIETLREQYQYYTFSLIADQRVLFASKQGEQQ